MRRLCVLGSIALFLFASGCGGCDDETGSGSGTATTGGDGFAEDAADVPGGSGSATAGDDGGTATAGDDGGTATAGDDGGTTGDAADMSTGGDGTATGMDVIDGYSPDSDADLCTGDAADLSYCDGNCVDTQTNDQHCGTCNNVCPTDSECIDGTCECPKYQEACNGQCVTTNLNADHCGTCNNDCTGNTVCNGGQCVDIDDVGCPSETEACGNECVDTDTDPDNCGSCGNPCPSGEACANGTCAPKVTVGSPPAKCNGPDPSISVGFKPNNEKEQCKGRVAKTTFRWGMCSCEDVRMRNNYLFDAFDSQTGPYERGGFGGGVGSRGKVTADKGEIFGALYVSGQDGIELNNTLELYLQLHSGGPLNFPGPESFFHDDAFVDADINKPSGGEVVFHQDLTVPSQYSVERVDVQGTFHRNSVNIGSTCRRCDPTDQIPIETIVKNHVNNNDNGAIGLNADALDQPGEEKVLELPCGKYYLSKVDVSHKTVIRATGTTALFIDGDVLSSDALTILAAQGAELDVFVNGSFTAESQDSRIGAPSFPAANRFYVNDGWESGNDTSMGAYIYSIPGGITLKNNLEVFGGIYTQNLQTNRNTNNNLEVHYDREILDADEECPEPEEPDEPPADGGYTDADGGGTTTGGDGGTSTGDDGGTSTGDGGTTGSDADGGGSCSGFGSTCSSDSDCCDYDCIDGTCGNTCTTEGGICSSDGDCCDPLLCNDGLCGEACTDEGGSCSTDSDCCDPYVCDDGTCAATSCNNLYETCSQDTDCCSDNCACSGSDCQCISG